MITFDQLRTRNSERAAEWPSEPNAEPWTDADVATELGGEVGEALNVVKKLRREQLGYGGSRATLDQLAAELADVVICTDLLARRYGIDLGAAVVKKFNATSTAVGCKTTLP